MSIFVLTECVFFLLSSFLICRESNINECKDKNLLKYVINWFITLLTFTAFFGYLSCRFFCMEKLNDFVMFFVGSKQINIVSWQLDFILIRLNYRVFQSMASS